MTENQLDDIRNRIESPQNTVKDDKIQHTNESNEHLHTDNTSHLESNEHVASSNVNYNTWLESYRKEYGEDPPPSGADWFHTKDPINGRVTRVYEGVVTITGYDVITGFAPTPIQLEKYLDLRDQLNQAKNSNDTATAKRIKLNIQNIVDDAQGEIPVVRSAMYKSKYGDLSPEEYANQFLNAKRDLFRKYQIEHMVDVSMY